MSANVPGPWWLVLICALAGLPLGWWLRRELATGGYRMEDTETGPLPGHQWLIALAVPVAWGLLAWRSGGVGAGTVLPALLLYAFVGVALFFIDADVHRLPEGLTFPLGISIAALLLVAAAVTQQWGSLGRAAICGVLSFVVYLVLLLASRGQFGFGDVVVGSITGLLLGYLGWPEPYWAAALGFVLGAVVSLARLARRRIGLKTEIAFGPYIVLGALVTVIALR